jgi:hypothetical protein
MVARHPGPDRPRMIVSNGIEITSNTREQQTEWHDIAPDLRFARGATRSDRNGSFAGNADPQSTRCIGDLGRTAAAQ